MCSIIRISPSWVRAGCKKTLCLLHYPRKIKFIHSFIHWVVAQWGGTRQLATRHQRSISTRLCIILEWQGYSFSFFFLYILANESLVSSEIPEASGPDEGEVTDIDQGANTRKQGAVRRVILHAPPPESPPWLPWSITSKDHSEEKSSQNFMRGLQLSGYRLGHSYPPHPRCKW